MIMTGKSIGRSGDRLYAYSLYAAVLSGAGLPIYIYAPKFFAENYGVSLTALGAILFGLRLVDVVQDPVLGWISERLGPARRVSTAVVAGVLALSMFGLFAVPPVGGPLIWFALTVTGLFSAFSFLTINFYALGIAKAAAIKGGHVRLAGWRETGALFGVCLAAVAPTLLLGVVADPFATFAVGFAGVTLWAAFLMDREWCRASPDVDAAPTPTSVILRDPIARSLLILAMVNAAPLAVSSTLFLFFVESRLDAPGWEGPLLVLFFLSAAVSAPVWSRLADAFGPKPVLLCAMVLAVMSFGFVLPLGGGDTIAFALVCVVSGATIGADLVLLPALFAARMSVIAPKGGQGFGLWAFTSKFTLAFAAAALLPLLERAGFSAGDPANPEDALNLLTMLYALVPCVLKLVAIALLLAIPLKEET
jgi:GPH family glycoside/pentoside/hexuronide:cation symporter